MRLVVGLGNPGKRYAATRHNVGFRVVELLAQRWGIPADQAQLGNLVGHGAIRHERTALARPQQYMNCSGQPVASLLGYYQLGVEALVVVHDEVELPFGQVRVKAGGGHGGHNGLRDLVKHLGADFDRVRVGIGRPPEGWDTADYVLGRFSEPEAAALDGLVETAADAVEEIVSAGTPAAIERFNPRPSPGDRPAGGARGGLSATR